MKRLRIFIRNFFGFSKTEANAAIVLILIVLLLAVLPRVYLRLAQDRKEIEVDSLSLLAWHEEVRSSLKPIEREVKTKPTLRTPTARFDFDPNSVSVSDLKRLGFRDFISERIANYRQAGGSFSTPTDLFRIYGIDSTLVVELLPYMKIEPTEAIAAPTFTKSEIANDSAASEADVKTPKAVSVDLNLATAEDLQQIRGIGPFYSTRVVSYRSALGGFHSMDQLSEVYGMKKEVVDLLKRHTFIGTGADKNILINSDSVMLLAKHPYISWNQARAIISYRQQHGEYQQTHELKQIKIIDDSLYQKILPYLSVDK